MAKDPYAVLGVEPGSTEQEIRAAYRQRARTEHPDINDAPNAEVGGENWGLGMGVGHFLWAVFCPRCRGLLVGFFSEKQLTIIEELSLRL